MASDRPAVSGGGRRGKNKADVTNGDPPTTTGGALGFIRELRGLFTKVEPLIHEFDALEKTQVDVGELRRQLEEKQQEMEKMKKGMQMEIDRNKMLADKHIGDRIESIKQSKSNEDTLGAELKKVHMQMEQLRTKHQEELSALETNLSDANLRQRSKGKEDMDQLKKEKEEALRKAQRYKRESERLTESLQIEKTRLELVKSNLEQTEEKLSSLGLEELDQTLEQAAELQNMSHTICNEFFYNFSFTSSEDYNAELKQELEKSGFVSSREASGDFPLLLSDTLSSRCMLMAWAESIIAEQVTTNIFRTTWLPPDSPLHDLFDAISNQLAIESPDKEAWWRSLTCDATQKLDWKILPFMCAKLRFIFKPLFKDNPTMLDEFLGRLDKFFCQCIDFWTCALHSERKVIAVLSSDPMDGEYHTDEHDIEVSPQEIRQNRSRVGRALPLFPGFGILDGANSTILLRGKSLPPSAPSAVRSRAEHWEIQNTLFNRVRERRDSDAVDEPSAIVPFSATQTTAFSWPSATDTPFSPTQGIVPTWPASAGANIVPNSPRAPPSHTTRQMPMSGAPGSGGVGLFNNSNGTGAERGR